MNADIPRLRCSGDVWSHEQVFLTIRQAEPLIMECPVCEKTERPVATDGGEVVDELPPLHVGDHVADREDDDATLLVIGTTTATADEYEAGGQTIADYNPDWPADDPVVECAYPQRTDVDVKGHNTYAFPRSRLRLVTPIHDIGSAARPDRLQRDIERRPEGLPGTVPEPRCGDMIRLPGRDDVDLPAGVYRVTTTSRRENGDGATYGMRQVDGTAVTNLSGEELAQLWATEKSALWPTIYPEVDLMHRRRDVDTGGITWRGEPIHCASDGSNLQIHEPEKEGDD